jgi:hypothetical protein
MQGGEKIHYEQNNPRQDAKPRNCLPLVGRNVFMGRANSDLRQRISAADGSWDFRRQFPVTKSEKKEAGNILKTKTCRASFLKMKLGTC